MPSLKEYKKALRLACKQLGKKQKCKNLLSYCRGHYNKNIICYMCWEQYFIKRAGERK